MNTEFRVTILVKRFNCEKLIGKLKEKLIMDGFEFTESNLKKLEALEGELEKLIKNIWK